MSEFAKYNAKDISGFHDYQPLKPFTQIELTALYEMWTKQERERIIKLLETDAKKWQKADKYAVTSEERNRAFTAGIGCLRAIALIKGEQK